MAKLASILTQRTAALAAIVFATLLAPRAAFALEDHAVLQARFSWIIPGDLLTRYPNGEMERAATHVMPRIEISRVPGGVYTMDVTLPPELTAGQAVTSRYRQQTAGDSPLDFVNVNNAGDKIECGDGASSWSQTFCNIVGGFSGVDNVARNARESYAQSRYGGTTLAPGMSEINGAEPAGAMAFLDASQEPVGSWVGRWSFVYGVNGQSVQGTMALDGYQGTYAPQAGGRGSVTNVFFQGGELHGVWEMNGTKGWLVFTPSGGNAFSGVWGLGDEGSPQAGTWNGRRL